MPLDKYFTGLNDVDLVNDALAKKPDLSIQKYEFIGSGVYAIETGGTSTLTPATSPSWNVNDYSSTVAQNLIIVDENNVVAEGKVTSNDATSVTFDETAMLLASDGTTAASFTVGNTYSFYILTPSSIAGNTYGPFFGFVEGAEMTLSEEYMQYKYSIPRKKIFQDLLERSGEISGGNINFDNEDVLATVFNADQYGSQTNQFSYGIGSDPDTNKFYRLTFTVQDRNNRALTIIVRKVQIALNGNAFSTAESGHMMLPFLASISSDTFYPDDADMIQIIRAD